MKFAVLIQSLVLLMMPTQLLASEKASVPSRTLKLVFAETEVRLSYLPRSEVTANIEILGKDAQSQVLVFSTPQFSAQPKAEVPVVLLKDFNGVASLEADIKSAGYDPKAILEVSNKNHLKESSVYSWSTPTKGSSIYFYLPNANAKNVALKIGPMAESAAQDYVFEWKSAQWKPSAASPGSH